MHGRDAVPGDEELLRGFRCRLAGDSHAVGEVEQWASELLDEPLGTRVVRLYMDDEDELAAVCAYDIDGEWSCGTRRDYFIALVAVRGDLRRGGVGVGILKGLVEGFLETSVGGYLRWKVDPTNTASVTLSMKLCAEEPESDPDEPHYLEFIAVYGDVESPSD